MIKIDILVVVLDDISVNNISFGYVFGGSIVVVIYNFDGYGRECNIVKVERVECGDCFCLNVVG